MTAAASSPDTGSGVLDDVAHVIGEAAAFALALEFRGQRLYVPQDHTREPRIAAAIGEDAARHFCEIFWRTFITFPFNAVIVRRVLELAGAGVKKAEIARQLGIREARVYAILAAQRDDRQLPLL